MAARRGLPTVLPLALAACCGAVEDEDRWLYEKVAYEAAPEIRSRDDAAGRFARLGSRDALGLRELYEMALYRSETLALSGEELVRIQTLYEQIRGSLLPRIAFEGSYLRQDPPPPSTGVQASLTLKERTDFRFTAVQPLFAGLREFHALRQTGALYRGQEHQIRHARRLLYADAADAFYVVLGAERELATTRDTLRLAEERLEELVQRQRVGISRRSEVLSQEAEVASIRASLERLKGAHAVAWEALRFVTGLKGSPELVDAMPDPGEVSPVEDFLERARARREDLKAARERLSAAEEGVGIARAGYLPTADLQANYYAHRDGVSAAIDWDVVLSFQVPLFEGGVAQAQMREARSLIRSSRLELDRLFREAALEINRAYAALLAFRSELASLEKAVASAQENYEIVQAEYRQNIATNLEVLTSSNVLQAARLGRDRARFQARLARVRLEVQSGVTPGEALP
jgi:outer membrane protein